MTQFSANLGFLWTDRSLPDAIHAAKAAGFDAVELHWPYDTPASALRQALDETGLPVLSLNTRRGNVEAGENGLLALTGRESDARSAIDEAIAYGRQIGAKSVHAMCGRASGARAEQIFIDNLHYGCANAAAHGMDVVIEAINPNDCPGYLLGNIDAAVRIIDQVDAANLTLLFDCYHAARTGDDPATKLPQVARYLGHIQFAGVPDRGPPDEGDVDYARVFQLLKEMGWQQPLGAEYKPTGKTDDTLGWLQILR